MWYKSEICFHILKHFQETLIIITYNVIYRIKNGKNIFNVGCYLCMQWKPLQITDVPISNTTPTPPNFHLPYQKFHLISTMVLFVLSSPNVPSCDFVKNVWNCWFFHFIFNRHVSYCIVSYCKGLHECKQNKKRKELQGWGGESTL